MAITADTDETDREGIGVYQVLVTRLGLVFREQCTSDFGVDAQVEMKREGRPTGRLVGRRAQFLLGRPQPSKTPATCTSLKAAATTPAEALHLHGLD